MEISEEKQKFYYWLCENVNSAIANLWLEEKWEEFIYAIQMDDNSV